MERRAFIKNTLLTSAGLVILPSFSGVFGSEVTIDQVKTGFLNPPDSSRPWCYWMWMNGHVTRQGITLDLEAMKRIGIGGAIGFNVGVGTPRGPVDYASPAWMDLVEHTAKEAERIGIVLTLQNSPGYSGCGGPWITPQMSMQQLVWTETLVTDQQEINITLPKPFAKMRYYQDAFIVAYPSLPVEKKLMKDVLLHALINGQEIDKAVITDGNPDTMVRYSGDERRIKYAGGDNAKGRSATATSVKDNAAYPGTVLLLEMSEPFDARAITILRKPEVPRDLFDGDRDYPPVFRLEASHDNITFQAVCTVNSPPLRSMDTPAVQSFESVTARYYRLVTTDPTWISNVELHNGPRLAGWPGKTDHTHGNSTGVNPMISQELVILPADVIDISPDTDVHGNLKWTAPRKGNWTILRIGHTTTGEEPAARPDSAAGLEVDKLSRKALDSHFDLFLSRVITRLKPYTGKSFKGIMSDSWEAGKQNWTPLMPEEFKRLRGYDILHWMPALTGRIVGSLEDTERFLWDFRKTNADLLAANFYGHLHRRCHEEGLEFYAEPYGDGNFDSLQSSENLDVPMAEFWTRYIYGSDNTSKQAASAGHVYGKKVIAAEAFTGMPATSKWTDYPYSLKAEGDYFFSLGINRLVFHTYVHQPYNGAKPGMTMGPFGTHFDRNNTWTDQAYGWTDYLKRAQYLLQQGLFVADVCYFKGDGPTSGIPDTYPLMPAGYVADVVGPDGLNRFKIENGVIVLPDGMRYKFCVMSKLQSVLPGSIGRLKDLVSSGMTLVVSGKPDSAFGRQHSDIEIRTIVDELYGDLDGKTVKQRNYGQGKLIWSEDLASVIIGSGIEPDFDYSAENQDAAIHYVHKRADGMEYYFISNHRRRPEKIRVSLRVTGQQPEIWNPETGEKYNAAVFEQKDGRTNIPLELSQTASVFVVFRTKTVNSGYSSVLKDGLELVRNKSYLAVKAGLYAGVQNNFSIAVWVKPDTFAHTGRSMIFDPPEGEHIYGAGHAAAGLSAGQNGVKVFERTKGKARFILQSDTLLQGWTYLVLVYKEGSPALYINGKLVRKTEASGKIVHPGLGAPPTQEQFSTYFEGNLTQAEIFKEVLSEDDIVSRYERGLPPLMLPENIELKGLATGVMEALIWKNGVYSLKGNAKEKTIGIIKDCSYVRIHGPWELTFNADYAVPAPVKLAELISLARHPDLDVRHFSGQVSYHKLISIQAGDLKTGQRHFIDLGRVEVIAEVVLNGKTAGIVWKEPYRLDITEFLIPGNNQLQVKVTTLWANRLIGDEHLPAENIYSKDGPVVKLPEWFIQNRSKKGERKTFSAWHNLDKDDPLLESGLLGPVHILNAVRVLF